MWFTRVYRKHYITYLHNVTKILFHTKKKLLIRLAINGLQQKCLQFACIFLLRSIVYNIRWNEKNLPGYMYIFSILSIRRTRVEFRWNEIVGISSIHDRNVLSIHCSYEKTFYPLRLDSDSTPRPAFLWNFSSLFRSSKSKRPRNLKHEAQETLNGHYIHWNVYKKTYERIA